MPLFGAKKDSTRRVIKKDKDEAKMSSIEEKYVLKDLLGT